MAVLGSLLFNRTLKQFLDCQDLSSAKGVELVAKLREATRGSLGKILEAIPSTQNPHKDILIKICVEEGQAGLEEELLNSLENDETLIRASAAQVLTKSPKVNPSKLFRRLHETDVPKAEIIEILEFQKKHLKPEEIISNAIKLGDTHAEQLLKMISGSEIPIDFAALRIEPGKIPNANLKLLILRYLSSVEEKDAAGLIGRFVSDKNKTISMEALKSLTKSKVKFDAAILLPNLESLSEMELGLALQILEKQATPALVPKLAAWTCGKSEVLRAALIKIVAAHVNAENLEAFLINLDKQEWWGKDQAIKALQKFGSSQLFIRP